MALELGVKLTRTRASDNSTSVSELRISKNTAGPVFVSTETLSSFILTCYLKGYNRNSFQIKISEDGEEISISGEKPVQEMLMMGRVMLRENVEIVGFRKVFRIPDGVVLDRIRAKFDEDESLLKIVMPKLVKGICGVQIEEVKNEGVGESSQQKASETGGNGEEGSSDKKLVGSTHGNVTAETSRKEVESPRFEAMKKSEPGEDEDHIPKNIGEESSEVLKELVPQPLEESDSIMLGRPPGNAREGKFEEKSKEEIGEVDFENRGKDEERVQTEMSKEGFEAIETAEEGEESEKVFAGKFGASGKDKAAEKGQKDIEDPKVETKNRDEQRVEDIIEERQKEAEETKFEREGKDEEMAGAKIRKEGFEELDTSMEGREPEKLLDGNIGVNGRDKAEEMEQKDIEEPKFGTEEIMFEREGKDEERVGENISKEGLEAIATVMEGREPEKVLDGASGIDDEGTIQGKQKNEIEETEFEVGGKDEERVGTNISKEGVEEIDTTIEGRETEKVLDGTFGVREEDILEGTHKKEIDEETRFESEGKDEGRVRKETGKGGLEEMEGREYDMVHAGEIRVDEKKQREVKEAELETEGKDEGREGRETRKEELEAMETRMEGEEPQKVHGGKIEVSKEGVIKGLKQNVIEDKDKERVKDIVGGKPKRDNQKLESENGGRGEDRVGAETSNEGFEALGTTTKGGASEMVLAGLIGVSGEDMVEESKQRGSEPIKFEIERGDEEKEGTKNNKKGLEATGSKKEGGESKKVGKIGVVEEDIVEETEKRGVDETKFEIEDRDKEKVEEVFKGTQEKEIGKNEFAIEGKDEEWVGTENMEEFEAKDTTVEGGVSEELLSGATGVGGKGIVEGTKKGEIDGFEARKTGIKESPMQERKLPFQLEESEGTLEGIERGDDKSEGAAKLKEIEEPEFRSVEENSKIQKHQTSKGENLEEIEEATEAMANRQGQEVEGTSEKVEGEEPRKICKEASEVNGNDHARDSGKKGIEESSIRSSGDGQHLHEELGTDRAKFPKQMSGTKAQREREVKVKEQVIVNEEKEGFEKATTGDRIQLEIGQTSDGRGFDEETSEAAKWDKTKCLEEGFVETEPSSDKVKGEGSDNVQGAIFSPFMKDNKRERTRKETEDPKVGTKHKEQHRVCVQELPVKIEESMVERQGPKDTKPEEMKEAKRKSEETQVVADEENIQEAEIKRNGKTNIFEKAEQEVPQAEDRRALGKGMRERENMLSSEACKMSVANHEREKWRTPQSVKDEKPRRKGAVKQVAESMQKETEKEHPGKSEVEKVKHLEAEVTYPELRKEVETKNEVEGSTLKELPPPKVRVQSLEPLESEKQNMNWKSPKNKKQVPEPREREEYEAGKPPEVKSPPSTQKSMVDRQKSEMDFPKSNRSRAPSEEKQIEALEPDVLSDQKSQGKERFKTFTEDRGHYVLEEEKRLETKKVAEEERVNQKDEEAALSCPRERTKIAECKDKERGLKKNGSEEINQIKEVAEEFKDVLADNEAEKSLEMMLPQTAGIHGNEKISEIREVPQEKRREIPSHDNEESEAVISNREVESGKPSAPHPKKTSMKFSNDKLKGEVDKLQRKKLEKLSKGPSKTSRPGIKEDAPTFENFPQFPEAKESTSSLERTKASESAANELDKPPAEKLEVAEEGKIDERHHGIRLEFHEPEKQESGLNCQESARRRSDQEVETTHFSQQEENHDDHAIEGEAENMSLLEIYQDSEDIEDIEVETSEKKVELRAPLVVAGSIFIASLIIFFFGHKRAGKR